MATHEFSIQFLIKSDRFICRTLCAWVCLCICAGHETWMNAVHHPSHDYCRYSVADAQICPFIVYYAGFHSFDFVVCRFVVSSFFVGPTKWCILYTPNAHAESQTRNFICWSKISPDNGCALGVCVRVKLKARTWTRRPHRIFTHLKA